MDHIPELNRIYVGDVLTVLRKWAPGRVHCVVTSPPYWMLRNYNVDGQIGLEESLDDYLSKIVEVFREVRRVLRPDGTCWVNLGDKYNSERPGSRDPQRWPKQSRNNHQIPSGTAAGNGFKPKDLLGIPWRVALGRCRPTGGGSGRM